MADVQTLHGYMKIANSLFEAIIKARLGQHERGVFDAIMRMTYGFNRCESDVSLEQFIDLTGISKPHVRRAIKKLVEKNMIVVASGGNNNKNFPHVYKIVKDFEKWRLLPPEATSQKLLPPGATVVASRGNRTIKDNLKTKEREEKTELLPPGATSGGGMDDSRAVFEKEKDPVHTFVDEMMQKIAAAAGPLAPKKTPALVAASISTVRGLLLVDGFDLEYIRNVLEWAVCEPFWSRNLLTIAGLRKQSANGAIKFRNMAAQYDKDPVVSGRLAAAAREKALDAETRRAEAEMMPRPGVVTASQEESSQILCDWLRKRRRA